MTGNAEWRARARWWIRELDNGQWFTSDDLLEVMGSPDEAHAANGRNNLIGSVFGESHRAGEIKPVGVAQSKQPRRKGGLVRVWERTRAQDTLL